ncbi:NADH-ubiquinone oxidoreductase [Candidatus Moduliflexus flocculans]|uniref:NADH-ubiquinone oxidoreductase n=1 Tax=Candidatus Moduliflexus flocculans TaxID=1499966 RepID=A0A081BMX4_9BACT|nr:NADH-ubiquinone oxidoreductase [Candidatus Moduliflexus flocculans]
METILERYTDDKSGLIQALQDTQKAYGYISKEHLRQISKTLGVSYAYVYATATFYKAFSLRERGKYIIKICDGTACHLKLSEDLVAELSEYLQIEVGETTTDNLFTLEQVNCLGACAMAPAISINEKLYGKLTRKSVHELIGDIKKTESSPSQDFVSATIGKVREAVGRFIEHVREGR